MVISNTSNGHLIWRPTCVCTHISGTELARYWGGGGGGGGVGGGCNGTSTVAITCTGCEINTGFLYVLGIFFNWTEQRRHNFYSILHILTCFVTDVLRAFFQKLWSTDSASHISRNYVIWRQQIHLKIWRKSIGVHDVTSHKKTVYRSWRENVQIS